MKKAFKWLDENKIAYQFHDFKKQGINPEQAQQWLQKLDIHLLINKRGTTWRQLDKSIKANLTPEIALKLMLDNPSIIKRPLLDNQGALHLGFKAETYQEIFA